MLYSDSRFVKYFRRQMKLNAGKRLKKYLKDNNMTYLQFSRKIKIDRSTVARICDKDRDTKLTSAYKIEAFTGGIIEAKELCPFIK